MVKTYDNENMEANDKDLMAYNLAPTRVYSYSTFKQILKNHGLPASGPSIKKMEKMKLIPAPHLPTAESTKSAKVYTGKQIKEIVNKLLSEIEGGESHG